MCHILPGGICYCRRMAGTPSQYVKLAAFAATLALLLGGGFVVGSALDPSAPRAEEATEMTAMHAMAAPVRGLAVAENKLRLVVDTPEFQRGQAETLRFRVVDEKG